MSSRTYTEEEVQDLTDRVFLLKEQLEAGKVHFANQAPMASANSPTCGHPKFPQARRRDYGVFVGSGGVGCGFGFAGGAAA
jgi:hypothetical protein